MISSSVGSGHAVKNSFLWDYPGILISLMENLAENYFKLNVIISLIWDFFSNRDFPSSYVATF